MPSKHNQNATNGFSSFRCLPGFSPIVPLSSQWMRNMQPLEPVKFSDYCPWKSGKWLRMVKTVLPDLKNEGTSTSTLE